MQGFQAAKESHRAQAYDLFCRVVELDPNNEFGWLYRAATTDDMTEAYVCLQRVLSINPNNQKAQRGVERIRSRMTGEEGETVAPTPTFGNGQQDAQPEVAQPVATSLQPEPIETPSYNPPVSDNGLISRIDNQPQVVADAAELDDQNQGLHQNSFSSNYAQASSYPYANEPQNFEPAAGGYTPSEVPSFGGQADQPSSFEQAANNSFYQPTPSTPQENPASNYPASTFQAGSYPAPSDNYPYSNNQAVNAGADDFQDNNFQPTSFQTGNFQAPNAPDNFQNNNFQPASFNTGNYQPDNYNAGSYQPDNYNAGNFQPASFNTGNYQPNNFDNQQGNFIPGGYPSDNYQAPTANYPYNNNYQDGYQTPANFQQAQQYPDFVAANLGGQNEAAPDAKGKSRRDRLKVDKPKTDKPKTTTSLRFGRRKEEAPLIATFGSETATDLDEVGKSRAGNRERRLAITLLVLAVLILLIAGVLLLLKSNNNNNNGQQVAVVATQTVPVPSTAGTNGTAGANGSTDTAGVNGSTAGANNGSTDTAGANGGNTDTAGANNGTPAGGVNGGNGTNPLPTATAAGANGGSTTTSGNGNNATTAPANTTTKPASNATTTAPANTTTKAAGATATPVPPSNAPKPLLYTVRSGDNLTNLARRYGTSIPAIVAANKRNPSDFTGPLNPPLDAAGNGLYFNKELIIPVSRPAYNGKGGIVVANGQTLASIASKYGVQENELISLNGLSGPNDVKAGDVILLP